MEFPAAAGSVRFVAEPVRVEAAPRDGYPVEFPCHATIPCAELTGIGEQWESVRKSARLGAPG